MEYEDLKRELPLSNDGDAWGTAMTWLFSVSDVLHFDRDDDTPTEEWGYRPSPIVSEPEESFEVDACQMADTSDLIAFGRLLHRYTRMLRAAGRDY